MMDRLKFQVISGTNKPLLSAKTCQKLGLLKLGSQAEVLTLDAKQAPLTAQSILRDWYQQLCGRSLSSTSTALFQTDTCSPQERSESEA